MNKLVINLLCGITILALPKFGYAQNCDIPIRIITSPQTENVPDGVLDMLNSRLSTAISSDGIMASVTYGQFFVTAKFNNVTEDVVPGPPKQFAIHSSLTLLVGDIEGRQIYNSKTFDLRGVGTSTQRAIINSFQDVNAKNTNFEQFINSSRDKIINYYNQNYRSILAKANKAATIRKFDEALYYACNIPECCIGYNEATNNVIRLFQAYIDYDSEVLYNKAVSAWSSSPNSEGAQIASLYISLIDPASSTYTKSLQLVAEIKETIRGDYIFDKQEKYKDSVALKNAYIDAARQIGVAYGKGQKETTNLLWIK